MSLPVVRAPVTVKNPEWARGVEGAKYYITVEKDVEVLTLNLNSGSMRVRIPGSQAQDISIKPFLEQYDIVRKAA